MSSAKLDEVLSAQKPSSDKTSLGYTILANSKSFVRPHFRKSSSSKTTHVCHHYGVSGYIRPNCFKLYSQK